jgi:hypothetical protein
MTAPLRPMNLGEILDRTFQIYRSKFLLFAGIALVPALVMRSVYIADEIWFHSHSWAHPAPSTAYLWNFIVGLGFYHIASIVGLVFEPAHFKAASSSILGEECTLASALRFNAARWRRFLWIALLKLAATLIGPEIVLAGLLFGIGGLEDATGLLDGGAAWPFVLLFTVPTVIGFYLFFRIGASLSLAIGASAIENLPARQALRHSWKLTEGTRLRIMFTWLAIFASSWILSSVLEQLVWYLMSLIGRWMHLVPVIRKLYLPVTYILRTAFQALIGPIYSIALTLFYYDQRIRLEGYDIERMMDSAGLTAPIIPPQAAEITAPEETAEARS